jgi:hypothetical protein
MVDNQLAGRSKGNHPQRFKLMPVTASRKLSARSLSTVNPPPHSPAAQQNPKPSPPPSNIFEIHPGR